MTDPSSDPSSDLSTDLSTDLTQDQTILLLTIAHAYMLSGKWPNWQYVVGQLDQRNVDAEEILRSLPRVGPRGALGPSYGFTSAPQHSLNDEDQVSLTIAAALPIGELRPYFAEPFLRTLHHMIDLQRSAIFSPTEVTRVWLESGDLARAMPSLKPEFINALPEILNGELSTRRGSSSIAADGSWRKEVTRDIQQYRQATDLEAYVATVCEIVDRQARQYTATPYSGTSIPRLGGALHPPQTLPIPAPESLAPAPKTYIDTALMEDLERAAAPTKWSLDKLISMAEELNSNYADDHPYACHMLLRAIVDHIPPAFGQKTFDHVINNHSWTRTDGAYVKKLREYRYPADDVLHRQIRESASRISMEDLPARPYVNALLQGLLDVLKTTPASA
ncbi:MAG: hypothetical protein JWN15_107 [Firmicutes bacterium]|nr:hypothetical protein [Bacillota bacterium]